MNSFLLKIMHKKYFTLFLIEIIFSSACFSQTITVADKKKIMVKEDSLKLLARYMITDSFPEDRMISDSIFVKTLVRTLLIKNSFYYPFDSVFGISKMYAPDSSFRIFTWNVEVDDYRSMQRGAIQFPTRDGSLKLIGLHDVSLTTMRPEDSVRNFRNWVGAVYYNIVQTEFNGKNYYTLFGFDPSGVQSMRKWIEVLHFDQRNQPVFGGPFFSYANDSIPQPTKYRFSVEFKKDARVLADYIEEMDMILVDHLISETDQPELKWTYVPDGDNEGFKWENGKWVHIDKVFTFKLQDGQAPTDEKILDSKGKVDEKKLQEKSDKNKTKEKPRDPVNYDN